MAQDSPHSLAAAANQVTKRSLAELRGMAREHDADSQNVAAVALAHRFAGMQADVLANTLANLLIDQVRNADTSQMFAPATLRETVWCEAEGHEGAHFDSPECVHPHYTDEKTRARLNAELLTGVEIRVIGPEANARAVLERMQAAGIPAHGTAGPHSAVERPNTVRFYTYTDDSVRSEIRQSRNGGHRRGGRNHT